MFEGGEVSIHVAIVDFIYLGEAKIDQENFESFLVIADELKLKGLTGLKKIFKIKARVD